MANAMGGYYGDNWGYDDDYWGSDDDRGSDDEMEYVPHFDTIDHGCFRMENPLSTVLCPSWDKEYTWMFYKITRGTLFEMLPYDILRDIWKHVRIQIGETERNYYREYFSDKQDHTQLLRVIRMNPKQRKLMDNNAPVTGLVELDTDLGKVFGRKILLDNQGGRCYNACRLAIEKGCNSVAGLNGIYQLITKWLVWICDHSYRDCWFKLGRTILMKMNEIHWDVMSYKNGKTPPKWLEDPDVLEEVVDIAKKIKFFTQHYLPYVLLSRSNNYFEIMKELGRPFSAHREMITELYNNSGIHPNNLNFEDIYEFEMMTYAPDYYNNVYLNYKMLRNGKRIIPVGERPMFFWCGDKYIHNFW